MTEETSAIATGKEIYEDTALNIEKDRDSISNDPASPIEKGESIQREDDLEEVEVLSHEDLFPPIEGLQEETHQLTIRAIFVGCCLGGVIAASK